MKFNKILKPMFSTVSIFHTLEDGSINAKYVIGTGQNEDDVVTSFTSVVEEWKFIEADNAQTLMSMPMTKDDIGKTPNEIMLDRIYSYLKESGKIII